MRQPDGKRQEHIVKWWNVAVKDPAKITEGKLETESAGEEASEEESANRAPADYVPPSNQNFVDGLLQGIEEGGQIPEHQAIYGANFAPEDGEGQ